MKMEKVETALLYSFFLLLLFLLNDCDGNIPWQLCEMFCRCYEITSASFYVALISVELFYSVIIIGAAGAKHETGKTSQVMLCKWIGQDRDLICY